MTTLRERRIFISIPLERHYVKVFSRYRDAYGRISYLRWTPTRKLHITVLYIGAVEESALEGIDGCLKQVASEHQAFALTLDKVSYAPPERTADMVWAYLEPSEVLDSLANAVYQKIEELGIIPADSFKNGRDSLLPHITLARFKDVVVQELIDLKQTGLEEQKLLVEEIQLLESKQNANGGEYKVLGTYELSTEG